MNNRTIQNKQTLELYQYTGYRGGIRKCPYVRLYCGIETDVGSSPGPGGG